LLCIQDLNSACPIDLVCNRGCGSAMMNKPNRLFEILDAMTAQLPSRSVTIKIRTGWNEKAPTAHELIPQLQRRFNHSLAAIFVSPCAS
jgi:tRNA-dihydrouridine synthase 3